VRNFTPVVEIGESPEAFVAAVLRAHRTPRVDLIARGIELARDSSWDAIVAAMESRVAAACAQPAEP
jgi:hypothetical protein